MQSYSQSPIQYGVKLTFPDGTVINWYRDGKRRTVYAERNPHKHALPRSATRIEEILATMDPAACPEEQGPPWTDSEGRPLGAFDGGADPNPGSGGWGIVLPDDRELCGGEAQTTNNRMELTGAIRLLEETTGPIRIIGDSRYVIDGITGWIHKWLKREWKTVSGSPVENRDLWEQLYALSRERKIVWEHVRGHSGHPLNERCDKLCAKGRRKLRRRRST